MPYYAAPDSICDFCLLNYVVDSGCAEFQQDREFHVLTSAREKGARGGNCLSSSHSDASQSSEVVDFVQRHQYSSSHCMVKMAGALHGTSSFSFFHYMAKPEVDWVSLLVIPSSGYIQLLMPKYLLLDF